MDSRAQPNRLSNLPDELLVLIISCLPFKDCVKTSVLSKRWRYLYRETRNVAFKASDFVSPSVYGVNARIDFVNFACQWVVRIDDKVPIDSFEISVPNSKFVLDKIKSWIAFAVGKKVKNLVLDTKHPAWRNFHDIVHGPHKLVFELPESIYNLTTLESLKVYACKNFEPWRFLYMSSSISSLSINECWGLDGLKIVGNIREIAFENCQFCIVPYSFNLPRVENFRYSGKMRFLEFKRMNAIIRGVYLDFDELRHTTCIISRVPCYILNGLPSV